MILVTGATGNVGRRVVERLVERGEPVRAYVRDPGRAALPQGVEVVKGDLTDPGALRAALDGVDAVFLLWPFFGEEDVRPVVAALAGRRIVYLSAVSADGEDVFARTERAITAAGGEWTFLRPGGFAVNTLAWAEGIKAGGVVREPYAEAGRSLIHEDDIAAVAVRALTEDGHTGQTYALTGPATLTQAEQARLIGEAVGRPVRFEEVDPEQARENWVASGLPPAFADAALDYHATLVAAPEPFTTAVADLLGRPAKSFAQWAADHADDFR
jgi:uncharacterized protein YbjT (DUF2867 family)